MKRLIKSHHLLLAGMIFLGISCDNAGTPTREDEDQIRNIVTTDFKEAWDVNDESAMAEFFLDDADLVFPTSDWITGKEAIKNAFNWEQAEGMQGEFEIQSIRFIGATTAIVNINAHFFGGKDKDGNSIPDYWDSATSIMVKRDGNWKNAALRVMNARMDLGETEAGIQASWDSFIDNWEKGDAEASANLFTKSTINMIPATPNNVGREAVLSMSKDFLGKNKVENLTVNSLELEVVGRTAFQYGTFQQDVVPTNGKPFVQKSRFFAVWKLEGDNVWKFHRFIFNDLP